VTDTEVRVTHYTAQSFDESGDPDGRMVRHRLDDPNVPSAVRRGLRLGHVAAVELHFTNGESVEYRLGYQ
jgi:hypothetical protein